MEESIFLKVTSICKKYPNGFTRSQIVDDPVIKESLEKEQISYWLSEYMVDDYKATLYGQVFIYGKRKEQEVDYVYLLSANAEQALIDYRELKEARESALRAQKQGNLAVVISIISMVISTMVGIIQIYTNTQI